MNILDTPAFVNTVNLVGVMGAGLAKQVAERWPHCVPLYVRACRNGSLTVGKVLPYRRTGNQWIIHAPTKVHWRNPSTVELVTISFRRSLEFCAVADIPQLHVPPMGCGHGGLHWQEVKPLLQQITDDYPSIEIVFTQ